MCTLVQAANSVSHTAAITAAQVPGAQGLQLQEVEALVRAAAAEVLGDSVAQDGRFAAGQFDSLSAVELANLISKAFGRTMPGMLTMGYMESLSHC